MPEVLEKARRLPGQVALVTGGGRGIGRAFALKVDRLGSGAVNPALASIMAAARRAD